MTITVRLTAEAINQLDLSPIEGVIEGWLKDGAIALHEHQLVFDIDYPREPDDPRELSEIPEVRLWFVRLDARYPWIPIALNWEAEWTRYTSMLVPHQFSPTDGIIYNPEALEIFMMRKVFTLMDWMQQHGISGRTKLKFMTQILGYELDDAFFDLFSS
ncbi:MAG TPA: CRR6 family NdhI maturation factor [Chroococcidiopsis sp.]